MNVKNSIWGLTAVATLWATNVLAAPAVNVGSNSVVQGTPTASISVNWDGDGTVNSAQFNITYDSANLTPTNIPAACNAASWSCSNNVPGTIIFLGDSPAALPDVLIATITFNTASAAIANYPLTVTGQKFANIGGDPITPSGTTSGTMTITAGPQPLYASTPTAATGVNLGTVAQEGTNPSANVVINNTGGGLSTTLDGTCSEFADPDNVFAISGDTTFSVPQAGPTDTVTVACNASGAVGAHTGTMRCTHNGSNTSPQDYNLSCTIAGPAYTSDPVPGATVAFTATELNDPDPTQTLDITNTGFTGTKLDVTCTDTVDPDLVFSVMNGAFVDLTPAGGTKVVTVTCDASSTVKTHTGTLSCTHNGSNTASPKTYDLSCEITPPGEGIFSSVPAPDATINLTPEPVAVGKDVPTKPLVMSNIADASDSDLQVGCYFSSGDAPPISQSPITGDSFTLEADGASVTANFDCDTSKVGNYSANFQCGYANITNKAWDSYADYTVTCNVREPAAVVAPTPADGTPQQAVVAPGGSHTFSFQFNETNAEGVKGRLESCGLDDGTNYEIISPASFPQDIPAGGSVTVQVKGTDPGAVDSFTDTLNCLYSDTEHPYETKGENYDGQQVSWPLTLVVGGDASFSVYKEFDDDDNGGPANPTWVDVTISCFTGLPLIQTQAISQTQEVTFIVQSFETGELDCNITEDLSDPALAGYTPKYYKEQSENWNANSCAYTDVNGGDEFRCLIVNEVDPVTVEITKDWIIEGMGGDQVNQSFELTLYCNAQIVDGYAERSKDGPGCGYFAKGSGQWKSCLDLKGTGDTTFTPEVIPEWPSSHCWVDETVYDDSAEVDNDCKDINVSHGEGDSCLITNTVFFEGIPTLSQYGMAIMALLMLGVGLVGFRRFI